jgi:diguanylate cyclase (GGDEF)-like protein/PAS domain S-box-containing protein
MVNPSPAFVCLAERLDQTPKPGTEGSFSQMSMVISNSPSRPMAWLPASTADERSRFAFDAIADGIFITDRATGRFIDINQPGCRMFGYAKRELVGSTIGTLSSNVHPYTQERAFGRLQQATSEDGETFEWQCRTRKGIIFWAEISVRYAELKHVPVAVATVREITERKCLNGRFRQLTEAISEVFWMTNPDKSTMLYVSPGYEAVWGRSCQSLYDDPHQWLAAIHDDDRARVVDAANRQAHGGYDEEYRIIRPDGEIRWIADRASPVRDENGGVYRVAGVALDTTERKRLAAQIEYMAHYDALTGLGNRFMLTKTLERAIAQSRRTGNQSAILALGLDHFKDVNENHGHLVGDQVIRLTAERLQAIVRLDEAVFRIGGDEFAIVLGEPRDLAGIAHLADRLIEAVSRPVSIDGIQIHLGASIGAATSEPDTGDADTLMSRAGIALCRAKIEGRQTYRFYCDAMTREVRSRILLTNELRRAIAGGELFVAYQPQVRAMDGCIVGVEALVRWNHPSRGVLGPASFLPVAQSANLIIGLDQWVLREACRQGRQWIDAGTPAGRICVNLSSAHFKQPPKLEAFVLSVLAETRLPPHLLELEITETTLIGFSSEHRQVMANLRSAGVRFSLDDFGTGYSSLSYLRRFAVDRIKIAREFIADLTAGADAKTIVKCIVNLARDLGNEVIAEGVETLEQLNVLQDCDCPDIQGFYFAVPMPADAILPLLRVGAITPARSLAIA